MRLNRAALVRASSYSVAFTQRFSQHRGELRLARPWSSAMDENVHAADGHS